MPKNDKQDWQIKKPIKDGNIQILLSREHRQFQNDIKNCFGSLNTTIHADYARLSAESLPKQIMILLANVVLGGLSWDLIKLGINKIFKKFKDARITIRDSESIMYSIFSDNTVKVIVVPERAFEFKKIKTLDNLIAYLENKYEKNKSWQIKKLREICNVFADGDWIEKKDQSFEGIRLIQTGNVGNGVFKDRGEKARFISEETFKRLRCSEILPADCLISRLPDPVGRACIIPATGEKMITAVDCTIVRFKKETILSKWFVYYTLSQEYQNQINKQVAGATRQRISRNNLGLIEIPLPPLPDQKRIVKILDEVFEKTAKAKANTEKNLQNAKALFESYLQSVFANPESDWKEKRMGEVCGFFNGFAFKSKDSVKISNTQLIRMGNLYQNSLNLDRWAVYYPDDYAIKYQKYLLKKDDLIISLTGTTGKEDYGYTVRIPKSNKTLLLNQRIAKIVILHESETEKDYLLHYLLSRTFLDKLYKTAHGTRQANLSTDKIKNILLLIPSVNEQRAIVAKLDGLSAETKKLEAIYKQKIANLEDLKKSVLKKAFSREL